MKSGADAGIVGSLERVAPVAAGFDGARLGRIGTALEREIAAARLPGAVVGILRGGRVAYLEAVGVRDPATGAAMTTDALFSIASMTKPMVSLAAMQLVEEGRLLLGDPVSAHVPELAQPVVQVRDAGGAWTTRPAEREPTVHDLLRHTSGYTYRDRGATPAHAATPWSSMAASVRLARGEFLERLGATPLLFEPGSSWEYGFSTDVLGMVVEAVAGQPLREVLAERIWGPLGMRDTGFDLAPGDRDRYARALRRDPSTGEPAMAIHHDGGGPTQWDSGGGGALSTAPDYLRLLAMLAAGGRFGGQRLAGRKTIEMMTTDHLPAGAGRRIAETMEPAADGYGFGLGFAVRTGAGARLYGSVGDYFWSGVYGTYFWVDPKEDIACVLMAAAPGLIRQRFRQLVRALVYQALVD